MSRNVALLLLLAGAAYGADLPQLRTEAVNAGSVFHVKNTSAQPLTSYLIELVDYPGSSYWLFTDEVLAPGGEKAIPVSNMTVGAVPDYVKITAASYADGSTAGAPDKVALLTARRKAIDETTQEAIGRLEKARQSGAEKTAAVAELKQWVDSLQPQGKSGRLTPALAAQAGARSAAATVLALLNTYSVEQTVNALRSRDRQGVEFARPEGKPLLLDLHVPDGAGPFPAAILVHGGGFDEGSRSTNVRPLFEPLANAGFAWFSIDYRLAPAAHLEEASADVNAAIRWLKAHAAEYHVDAAKIVLIGESAGGYLVNYAGTHYTPETRVAAVVDIYGPVDYGRLALERREHPERFNMTSINRHAANGGGIRFFGVQQLDESGLKRLREVSPIAGVHKGMPPFLCIHGTKDDQVTYDQSTMMCDTMRKAGAACELITVEGGGHGMSGWRAPEMQHWKGEMIAWLKKTLTLP